MILKNKQWYLYRFIIFCPYFKFKERTPPFKKEGCVWGGEGSRVLPEKHKVLQHESK